MTCFAMVDFGADRGKLECGDQEPHEAHTDKVTGFEWEDGPKPLQPWAPGPATLEHLGATLARFEDFIIDRGRAAEVARTGGVRCRVCGCTEGIACDGGCTWVEADLCSECVSANA